MSPKLTYVEASVAALIGGDPESTLAAVVPLKSPTRAHYHPPLQLREKEFDLSHLDPFQFEITTDKFPRPLTTNVRFTNHCFSERFDVNRHLPDEPEIMDGIRRRAFCPIRYSLSFRLPELVRGLSDNRAKVHQTSAIRNWMYSTTVEELTAGTRYQIFFELTRTANARRHLHDLDMVVESAYPAASTQNNPNILGLVRFALLAGNTYIGRPTATRR